MANYECPKCGGSQIQVKAWVDLNKLVNKTIKTEYVEKPDSPTNEDYWCMDCQDHIKPEEIE